MAPKYNPSEPPKKVRQDKPSDSKKNYLNPFRTQIEKAFHSNFKKNKNA